MLDPKDYPAEFRDDIEALQDRFVRVFPSPELQERARRQEDAEFYKALAFTVFAFVLLIWWLP